MKIKPKREKIMYLLTIYYQNILKSDDVFISSVSKLSHLVSDVQKPWCIYPTSLYSTIHDQDTTLFLRV